MKKLIYLILTVLIVACSSDDSNDGTTLNSQFVGSWLDENSSEENGSLTIEFNADGTGNAIEFYDGITDTEIFSWSSTSTQLTVTFAPDDVDIFEYEFINYDQLRLRGHRRGWSIIHSVSRWDWDARAMPTQTRCGHMCKACWPRLMSPKGQWPVWRLLT